MTMFAWQNGAIDYILTVCFLVDVNKYGGQDAVGNQW